MYLCVSLILTHFSFSLSLYFPHAASRAVQCHPAVKPFGERRRRSSAPAEGQTEAQTDIRTVHTENHGSISRACVYHRRYARDSVAYAVAPGSLVTEHLP